MPLAVFEVTSANAAAGNLSFEDTGEYAGYPRGGWQVSRLHRFRLSSTTRLSVLLCAQGGRNWRGGSVLASDSTVTPLIIENIAEELDAE